MGHDFPDQGQTLFPDSTGARFSPCGHYRYRLWRLWDDRPVAAFVMLNPSTADDVSDDPTVARCSRRAQRIGAGGVEVVNIFALRSTRPRALYAADDPVGPDNDEAILAGTKDAGWVICAWGNHGLLHGRGAIVLDLLRRHGRTVLCLTETVVGQPGHPLYLPYSRSPRPLRGS